MDERDEKIRRFFESCLAEWERKHGRRPETRDDMWEAVIDGMERSSSEKPKI